MLSDATDGSGASGSGRLINFDPTMLETPYALPYAVDCSDELVLSIGEDAVMSVSLIESADPVAVVDDIDALLTPFVLLAQSGALAGADIEPARSTIADKSPPIVTRRGAEWRFRSCRIDACSIVMINQMLMSVPAADSIARIVIAATDRGSATFRLASGARARHQYPSVHEPLPFRLLRTNEVLVTAQIIGDASLVGRGLIDAHLGLWSAGVVSGAYPIAPVVPDECTAEIDDVVWTGNEMSLHLSRFLAHPAAIDGLLNALVHINHRIARIGAVEIE
jgi:hypothetical protein